MNLTCLGPEAWRINYDELLMVVAVNGPPGGSSNFDSNEAYVFMVLHGTPKLRGI